MGNDILSGLSPGYRRGSNSPSFRRSLSFPDISWRSLAHRHKFLLCMLGLLTLLCIVYLYFAITLGSSDLCSGLRGVQRTRCQMRVNREKAESLKIHHRRLLNVEDSDSLGKTRVQRNTMAFASSSAGRKDLMNRSSQKTEIPVSVNGQQRNFDDVNYKATLEFELKKNHKPLKAS